MPRPEMIMPPATNSLVVSTPICAKITMPIATSTEPTTATFL